MFVRLDRLWRRRAASIPAGDVSPPPAVPSAQPVADERTSEAMVGVPDTDDATSMPEQPVPLAPIDGAPPARVGVLVPARRHRALPALPTLPVPRVPKRAIFVVGIAAGLATPVLGRQLTGRMIAATFGGRAASGGHWESAAVEIIRVTFGSARPGDAAAAAGKLVEQIRR